MARWQRAVDLLSVPAGSRVLDLGCAFGFGTRLLVPPYRAYGHDLSETYIRRARRRVKGAVFTCGPAESIPYPNGYFDAILLLDVLEHVPAPDLVVAEMYRVLRPGGELIVSVPNMGLLHLADSLNLYQALLTDNFAPPTDDPSWARVRRHRHYDRRGLEALLGDRFDTRRAVYTGLGIAELINLPLLLIGRPSPLLHWLYNGLQYIYYLAYMLEDNVPAGTWGYHMMVKAERR